MLLTTRLDAVGVRDRHMTSPNCRSERPFRLRTIRAGIVVVLLALGMVSHALTQVLSLSRVDQDPALAAGQTPGRWYVDRYAPHAFERAVVNGGNRLRQAIGTAEAALSRPAAHQSAFYNTQGRKFDLGLPAGTAITADLFIPASWRTNHRRADLWATMGNDSGGVTDYPIIGFANTTGTQPMWRVWVSDAWVALPDPPGFTYDAWYTLKIELTASEVRYSINGQTVYVATRGTSTRILNMILQAYNFGDPSLPADQYALESYDVYWDNIGSISRVHNLTRDSYHVTIQDGVNAAAASDTLAVAAGTFPEQVFLPRPITLIGPGAGIDPSSGIRPPEAIITSPVSDTLGAALVTVAASAVTLDGLMLDGDNAAINGGALLGGADVNAAYGITNDTTSFPAVARITVTHCIIRNIARVGVRFRTTGASAPASSGSNIADNLIENIPSSSLEGTGIWISYNFYAAVTRNVVRGVYRGILSSHFYNPGSPSVIDGNIIEAVETGIWHNLYRQRVASVRLPVFVSTHNNVEPYGGSAGVIAFKVTSIFDTVGVRLTDNRAYGVHTGIQIWNCPTADSIRLNRDTIDNYTGDGLRLQNVDPTFGPGGDVRVRVDRCSIIGLSAASGSVGVLLRDEAPATSSLGIALHDLTEIDQGADGIVIEGAHATIDPSGVEFSGLASSYIRLRPNAVGAYPHGTIDATQTRFEGSTASGLSDSELLFIERGIVHGVDIDGYAFVRVKPGWVFVTPAVGNLQRGIGVSSPGDRIRVFGGTYQENIVVPATLPGVVLMGDNAGIVNGSRLPGTVIRGSVALLSDRAVLNGFDIDGGGAYGGDTVGVWMNGGATGQQVRATLLSGPGVGIRRGILTGYDADSVIIDGNTFSGWTTGVYLNPTHAPRGIRLTQNTLRANIVGVGSDGINNILLRRNAFVTNQVEGWGYSDVSSRGGQSLQADSNTFAGNGIGVRNYTDDAHPDTIHAENNDWGSVYGPRDPVGTIEVPEDPIPSVLQMKNMLPAGALGDSVGERVMYFPWLGRSVAVVESPLRTGWNLISTGRRPFTTDPAVIFPGTAAAVFGFDPLTQNTEAVTRLVPEHGYWVKVDSSTMSSVAGARVDSLVVTMSNPGWVIVGSLTDSVAISSIRSEPADAITGPIFRYNRTSQVYEPATSVTPGEGYWVKIDKPCVLRIR